jgi:hypothetical protein
VNAAQEERLARNEAFFRDVNERINEVAAHLKGGDDSHPYSFFCECSDATCAERITLTLAEYEGVRAESTRFVLAPGHIRHEIEHVVAGATDYVVIEKDGLAGSVAAELDPRDP